MERFVASSTNVLSYCFLKAPDSENYVVNAAWDQMPSASDVKEGLAIIAVIAKLKLGPSVTIEYTDAVKATEASLNSRAKAEQKYLETGIHGLKTRVFTP